MKWLASKPGARSSTPARAKTATASVGTNPLSYTRLTPTLKINRTEVAQTREDNNTGTLRFLSL